MSAQLLKDRHWAIDSHKITGLVTVVSTEQSDDKSNE